MSFFHLFVAADQRATPRRGLPIDVAWVFAGNVRPQALKVRACSPDLCRFANDLVTLIDFRQQLVLIGTAKIRIDFSGIGDDKRDLLLD